MDMVDHEVNGVEEAVGKENGRCSSGGELGFRVGSFCKKTSQREPKIHQIMKPGTPSC